ncbi:hypothetical protein POM88_010028 [Heracleum sosnowskyi]|uniref:Uncharacterized protein n=1 Tax=Heracleum sosnowskyi TaxID=360622 RepID=A0AAD8JCW5_9APIA|nr:hypothetical protein POM88_010028 [Heracleum sosnowskyi]
MELPVLSDCGVYTSTDRILFKEGSACVNMASTSHDIAPQQPAIKQTRQWAAWTRQEEECFFSALRQVGKVSHYYYRLVRRMNKLLDLQLCLDSSNSKDTNSAIIRCKIADANDIVQRFFSFKRYLNAQGKSRLLPKDYDIKNNMETGVGVGASVSEQKLPRGRN